MKFGDRNTKFFHTQTIIRRRRNKIHGITLDDGSWCTDPNNMKNEALSYYKNLFSSPILTRSDLLPSTLVPSLSRNGINALTAPVCKNEVRKAVFSMKSYKAPGPDGFQPLFFKHFWEVVGDDLWNMVRNAISRGYSEESMAEILMVLIPKIDHPRSLKKFRPISLCNVAYKVITKVLVQRIRPFLYELIGPLQSSFIPGRSTNDNVILAQEVIHFMHHSKSQSGFIAYKLDLEKAYDRVSDFLEETMRIFNFPEITINLIIWCVKAANLSILWNGEKLESFKRSRGLCQGDPLSSYLFVLCMERLALSIQQKLDSGLWHPIQVSRGGPKITHIFFADDVMLFCRANTSQINLAMDTVNNFCEASGLKVSIHKSKGMYSLGLTKQRKSHLANISPIKFVSNLGSYLGFPLIQGKASKKHYEFVVEKIQRRMTSWKGKLLNKTGKICLAKSVTSSIPIYPMQIRLLPKNICTKIDSLTRGFIWGKNDDNKGWSLVNWETVTAPQKYGGLGIRDSRTTNEAFLGKLVWNILNDNDKLWVQVLKHKYIGQQSLWNINTQCRKSSITWKSISKAAVALQSGFEMRINSGNSSLWYSDWTGRGQLYNLVNYVHISDTQLCVKDIWENGSWKLQDLSTPLNDNVISAIMATSAPNSIHENLEDCWAWKDQTDGIFKPALGYGWLVNQRRNWNLNTDWSWIWKLGALAKV